MIRPTLALSLMSVISASAFGATLAHRYSFDGTTADSVGGNTGVLLNGATVNSTHLVLPGTGTGAGAANMGFTNIVGMGSNFGASGVTIESWYTDNNSGTWAKLFTFGTSAAGQEIAWTNFRGGGDLAPGLDRNGAKFLSGYPAGSNTRLSTGTEHHLVLSVASDGTTDLWVDGTQQITGLATNALSNVVSTTESIGATAWADPGHNGTVNEFRIWSGPMTNEEATRNFALGPNVVPEPVSIVLVGLGLLGILRRRR